MSQFYADEITQQSEQLLRRLRLITPGAVILGGWATFLYAGGQRSKDVDIGVTPAELTALQHEFGTRLTNNPNLRMYEVKEGAIDLDILVGHYSNPGIRIERLLDCTRTVEGFTVVCPEGLLLLKLCAWNDRQGRPKGDKDEVDVASLLMRITFDWAVYRAKVAVTDDTYRTALDGAIGRLFTSATMRKNWQHVLDGSTPAFGSDHAWRAWVKTQQAKIPSGL